MSLGWLTTTICVGENFDRSEVGCRLDSLRFIASTTAMSLFVPVKMVQVDGVWVFWFYNFERVWNKRNLSESGWFSVVIGVILLWLINDCDFFNHRKGICLLPCFYRCGAIIFIFVYFLFRLCELSFVFALPNTVELAFDIFCRLMRCLRCHLL